MVDIYITNQTTGKIDKIDKPKKGCWINIVKPTEQEIKDISKSIKIDEQILKYPLDLAEKAHIDTSDDSVLIIVDAPVIEYKDKQKNYTTMPLGMILVRDDIFITISQVKINSVMEMLNNTQNKNIETNKKSRFVFKILFKVAEDYIRYLTYLNKDLEKFETKMQKTMSNDELLKLLSFQKTMIFFNTSVKANEAVLVKLNRGNLIKLYSEDEEMLEDTIIENRQAIEMIATYSEILNGIIEIFGTMVSNNLNNVMKILTSITLIIAIPTLITSFMGMNVTFPFDTSELGFLGVVVICVVATSICALILKRKKLL